MTTPIPQEEYETMVAKYGGRLAEYAVQDVERDTTYESKQNAVLYLADDVLDGHQWFTKSYYGPAAHGEIIEWATEAGVNPAEFTDISIATDARDPAEVVKRLAYIHFEAAVIQEALDQIDD